MELDRAGMHPMLAARSSPVAFDASHELSEAQIAALLEAARWAPSAGNSQPWSFIVGRRGDEVHTRIVDHLAGSSARWAPAAGVLIANLAHRYVEGTDWEYSEFWSYDLGQAVAHMTIQAQALGLATRQFRAFDRRVLHVEFAVQEHWQLCTITAVGLAAGLTTEGSDEPTRRERRPIEELLWTASR